MKGKKKQISASTNNLQAKPPGISTQAHAHLL